MDEPVSNRLTIISVAFNKNDSKPNKVNDMKGCVISAANFSKELRELGFFNKTTWGVMSYRDNNGSDKRAVHSFLP